MMKKFKYIIRDISSKIFILSLMSFFYSSVHAQGSWNIKYSSIDSLNTKFIGKEIRIDFKGFDNDTINKEINVFDIRRLLSKRDTITLKLRKESCVFIEDWKLYVDHGSLSDQNLESVGGKVTIKQMTLTSINDSSITIKASIVHGNETEQRKIKIEKSDIKGILTQITS